MLHHHASVLLDNSDISPHMTDDSHQTNNDAVSPSTAAAADDDDDDDANADKDAEKVQLLIVGGGGNCFSFGTHFNQRMMMLTIRSSNSSDASNSGHAVS